MDYTRKRSNSLRGRIIYGVTAVAVFSISFLIGNVIRARLSSNAEEIEDGIRVQENSELKYFLQVKYDGVDRQGIESSDSVTSEVRSGVISVSDKIPDGLTFLNFVESEAGSFGAVERSDGVTPCAGKVIDDTGDVTGWNADNSEFVYHGLHYTAANRTVNFSVRNLKAGCQLQVGIVTRTPYLAEGEKRRDFYNTANVLEGGLGNISNTVHTFIGRLDTVTYKVSYQYTGDVPTGAPGLPADSFYAVGNVVGLATDPRLDGYEFSGWATSDATIADGSFTMPEGEVALTGTFVQKATNHSVSYVIDGEKPEGFMPPNAANYGVGDEVTVDDFAAGAVFGGYTFSGWTTSDVTVSEGSFAMPNKDVVFTGTFEKIGYNVSYQFEGTVLPPNAASLLPAVQKYYPGDTVTVAAAPTASGYQFSGWYGDASFTMPENDIVIQGEWSVLTSVFRPQISQRITNPKDVFYDGDTVKFEITVTNTASYDVANVNLMLVTDGTAFSAGDDYEIRSDKIVEIASLPAGASIKIYAEYPVSEQVAMELENTVKLVGATATGNNRIDLSDEALASYVSTVKFKIGERSSGEGGDEPGGETPKTEDEVMKYIIVGIASAVVLAVIVGTWAIMKKKNKN